jgi:nucleotide-binding universal stress UspA family protein
MSTQQTTGPSTPGERADAAKRIVVGIDGSPSSHRALEWAGRQAALTSATLHLLTTWHVPFSDPLSGIPDYPDFQADAEQILSHAITAVLGDPSVVPCTTEVLAGPPGLRLTQAAVGAELLVVGSHGHGEFTGLLLGSVGLHCATHAPCPVVIIHEHRSHHEMTIDKDVAASEVT